ncbi:hypothetical protein GC163_23835 [bacterium]|nr:hypothetical protein [bacterium]
MRRSFGLILLASGWLCNSSTGSELRSEEPTVHEIPAFQIVITIDDQRTTLLDQARRVLYSTDSAVSRNRLEKFPDGTLFYKTEQGDNVQIDANGGRSTGIESLGVSLHEWVNGDRAVVDNITIPANPEFAGRLLAGWWRRTSLHGRTWVSNTSTPGTPATLLAGEFELLDVVEGTLRFSDDGAHFRGTFHRDGTSQREYLNHTNELVRRSIETFPAGNELDRRVLSAAEIAQLYSRDGIVVPEGGSIEEVNMIQPDGYVRFRLIETVVAGRSTVQQWIEPSGGTWSREPDDRWGYRPAGKGLQEPRKLALERLDGQTFRLQFDSGHLRKTIRTDGSSIIEFLGESSELSPELKLTPVEVAEYTLESDVHGLYRLTDRRGNVYREVDPLGGAVLTVDDTRRSVTFVDPDGRRITLSTSGERSIVDASGNRLETDSGGRMTTQRDPAGKIVADYFYTEDPTTGNFELTAFKNSSGLWKRSLSISRAHAWIQTNDRGGPNLQLDAESIQMNRHNAMVTDSKGTRTIRTLNETEIVRIERPTADGGSETETRVGARETGTETSTTAYVVKTVRGADGQLREQHFMSSGDGHIVCRYEGPNSVPGPWERLDGGQEGTPSAKNLAMPDLNWRGFFAIDDTGTLIKRTYAAPEGRQVFVFAQDVSEVNQTSDQSTVGTDTNPIVPHTIYALTDGTSRQTFDDGREIYRDRDGDIVSLRKADGRTCYVRYGMETGPDQKPQKTIIEFEENGRRWKFHSSTGTYVGGGPFQGLAFGDAVAEIKINNQTGAVIFTDLSTGLDGKRSVGVSLPDGQTRFTNLHRSYVKRTTTTLPSAPNTSPRTASPETTIELTASLPMCSRTPGAADSGSEVPVNDRGPPVGQSLPVEVINTLTEVPTGASGDQPAGLSAPDGPTEIVEVKAAVVSQTAADGTLTHYIDNLGTRYDIDCESPNDIAHCRPRRIDVSSGLVVAVAGYEAPADHPLPADAIVGVTNLALSGWGEEKHIVCVNSQGRLMRIWANRSSEEYELATGGNIRRITTASGQIYASGEAEAGEQKPYRIVTELSPWTGERAKRSFEYRLDSGERMRIFNSTAWLLFDLKGDLKESLNSRWRATDYHLPPEPLQRPEDIGKRGDRMYGPPTVPGATRHALHDDIQWVVEHADKLADGRDDDITLELFDIPSSTRQVLDRSGAMSFFDADGRLDKRCDVDGVTIFAEYEAGSNVPVQITGYKGTWARSQEPLKNSNPAVPPVYRWTNAKEHVSWDGDVQTALSGAGLVTNGGLVVACIDGDIIKEYHARITQISVNRRGTRTLRAVDALYRETTYEYAGGDLPTVATVKNVFGGETVARYEVGVEGVKALHVDRTGQVNVVFDSGRSLRRLTSGAVIVMPDPAVPDQISEVICPDGQHFQRGPGIAEITLKSQTEVHVKWDDGATFMINPAGATLHFDINGRPQFGLSAPDPGEMNYEWMDDELISISKSASDAYGHKYAAKFQRQADGTWEDDGDRQYQGMRLNRSSGDVMLFADNGRTVRVLVVDGEEFDVRYDGRGTLLSSVRRDPLGRPLRIQDSRFNRTHLVRNADGELTRIIQGDEELFKKKDDSFCAAIAPALSLLCEPQVEFSGKMVWLGRPLGAARPGMTRVIHPDGTLEISRLDGATEIHPCDRSEKTFRYANGNEVAEVTAHQQFGLSVTLDDGTAIRQGPFATRLEFLRAGGHPQINTDGSPRTASGALAVSQEGHLTIDDRDAGTLTVCFADGKRLQFQRLQDGEWMEANSGDRYPDRAHLIRTLGAMDVTPLRPSNSFELSDARQRNWLSSLFLGLELFAPRSIFPPTATDGERHWKFDAGVDNPSDTYITEVIAQPDGLVKIIRSDGSETEAYPGISPAWPKLQSEISRLDQQYYSSRGVAALLSQLQLRYDFTGVQMVAEPRQQSLWNLAWAATQNTDNPQVQDRGKVLTRRAFEAGLPGARSALSGIIDISAVPATTNGIAPAPVPIPRYAFTLRKVVTPTP